MSALQIDVHPLCLINISDHLVRALAQHKWKPNTSTSSSSNSILGCLLGTQVGRKVEIFTSFELKLSANDVDVPFTTAQLAQYKQVFPAFDCLGWYCVGADAPTAEHLKLHQQFHKFNEAPLFLLYEQGIAPAEGGDLPFSIYECLLTQSADSGTTRNFSKVTYNVCTTESERIAIEHVSKQSSEKTTVDYSGVMLTQLNALKMLYTRIESLHDYVVKAQEGGDVNLDVLRAIGSVCNRIPLAPADEREILVEREDAVLACKLAALTKGITQFEPLVSYLANAEKPDRKTGGDRKERPSKFQVREGKFMTRASHRDREMRDRDDEPPPVSP